MLTYDYDGLDRLIAAQSAVWLGSTTVSTYTYDLVGNRIQVWTDGVLGSSRSYNAADQVNNLGWDYDEAGNLLSDGSQDYFYDALGRLTKVEDQSTLALSTYQYNGDGTLLAQTAQGTTTNYVQDQAAPFSQVLVQDDGTTATSYLYGLQRLGSLSRSTRTWELHDGLGSVRQTLDSSGTLLDSLTFDPWGTPESGTPAPFGFTGELQDNTAGLVHLRARWYQPDTGQFMSRDPFDGLATNPYSQHPYQYAYSNPTRFTDHTGKYVDNMAEVRYTQDAIGLEPTADTIRLLVLDNECIEDITHFDHSENPDVQYLENRSIYIVNPHYWRDDELKIMKQAVERWETTSGWGLEDFEEAFDSVPVYRWSKAGPFGSFDGYGRYEPWGAIYISVKVLDLQDTWNGADGVNRPHVPLYYTFIHELAHRWDDEAGTWGDYFGNGLSDDLIEYVDDNNGVEDRACEYGEKKVAEDVATSVTRYITNGEACGGGMWSISAYPDFDENFKNGNPSRKRFIKDKIDDWRRQQ